MSHVVYDSLIITNKNTFFNTTTRFFFHLFHNKLVLLEYLKIFFALPYLS